MAGFWAGFGEQFSSDLKERQRTLERLVEENLANARSAKRDYAKRKNSSDQVLKSAQAIRSKFGLDDAQSLALVEAYGTDLPRLQATLDAENDKLKSSLGVGYTAQDVMSFTNTAKELALPEGMTLEKGVRRLMGLNAMELAKEADPKSEGAKTRSFIRSALAYDPQLQAADTMQKIKGPGGLSYAQLLEMQEAGFAPEDVYGDVTRAGGVTYDYTTTTAKTTRTDYSSRLSRKIFDADLTNELSFSSYSAGEGQDKNELKSNVTAAGDAIARLEREIVLAFRGTDMAMNAFRKSVLDDIYDRVDSPEELATLAESIRSGNAIAIIEAKDGKLTDEDIDAIIAGKNAEEETPAATDDLEKTEAPTPETTTEPPTSDTAPSVTSTVDSEVDRMISEQTTAPEEEDGLNADALVAGNAGEVAAQIEQFKDTAIENAKKYTYQEYKDMSRDERREAGLPVRPIDGWAAFGIMNPEQYFKGGAGDIDTGNITESTTSEEGSTELARVAMNVYDAMQEEFPDMTVLQGEDGKQIIKDYMEQNNIPLNEILIDLIQKQLPLEE